jgi:hypothetical protein
MNQRQEGFAQQLLLSRIPKAAVSLVHKSPRSVRTPADDELVLRLNDVTVSGMADAKIFVNPRKFFGAQNNAAFQLVVQLANLPSRLGRLGNVLGYAFDGDEPTCGVVERPLLSFHDAEAAVAMADIGNELYIGRLNVAVAER